MQVSRIERSRFLEQAIVLLNKSQKTGMVLHVLRVPHLKHSGVSRLRVCRKEEALAPVDIKREAGFEPSSGGMEDSPFLLTGSRLDSINNPFKHHNDYCYW